MNIFQNNISDITQNHYDYFFNMQNVNGVGVGFKFINEIQTKELCLHVMVKKKIDKSYLTSNNIIPKTYMGIKTDVIEVSTPKMSGINQTFTKKYRPLKSGCSIYAEEASLSGTLGCILVKKTIFGNKYYILSNNHVLADNNILPIGTKIIQPSKSNGGIFNTDVIAKLSKFVPIKFSIGISKPKNFVDCAIAEVTNKSLISNELIELGKINGIDIPKLGERVRKVGATTGVRDGKIKSFDATMTIDCGFYGKAVFSNQILTTIPSMAGDSGSIVLNDDNKAVGLFFAGDDSESLINDINIVLKELKASIYQ